MSGDSSDDEEPLVICFPSGQPRDDLGDQVNNTVLNPGAPPFTLRLPAADAPLADDLTYDPPPTESGAVDDLSAELQGSNAAIDDVSLDHASSLTEPSSQSEVSDVPVPPPRNPTLMYNNHSHSLSW